MQKADENDQFKRQALRMMKEQSVKIRESIKQIQMKEERINFYKETLCVMEEQKEALREENIKLKRNMKQMVNEISDYNKNIIQKIYEQNKSLLDQLNTLKSENIRYVELIESMKQQIRVKEQQCNIMANDLKDLKQRIKEDSISIEREERKYKQMEKENNQIKKNSKLQNQLEVHNKQVQLLSRKYQQNMKESQIRIKKIKQEMIQKSQYRKLEQKIQKVLQQSEKMMKEYKNKIKQFQEYKNKVLREKEINIDYRLKNQENLTQIRYDITNLQESIRYSKLVNIFQSQFGQALRSVFEEYERVNNEMTQLNRRVEHFERSLGERQGQIQRLKIINDHLENQLQSTKQGMRREMEMIEVDYESKLLKLAIKIKQEEQSLSNLIRKQNQFDLLETQYNKLQEQFGEYKNTMQNTIKRLQLENETMMISMQQLSILCEQNIETKNSLNKIKYIINALMQVVFYLHLLGIRNRQKTIKLYEPFINYYYRVHSKISKTKNVLFKWRAAVWVVIGVIRMSRNTQITLKNGLYYNIYVAHNRRNNILQMNSILQEIMKELVVSNDNSIQNLIKIGLGVYSWDIKNYNKIILPVIDDENKLI